MSAREIIEQIQGLPDHEIRMIEEALRKRRAQVPLPAADERTRSERFADAKAHLFGHYGDLLEKLAK